MNVAAQVAVRPRAVQREYSYDDLYDRDRRYGSGTSLGSLSHVRHEQHRHGHGHHGHRSNGSRSSINSRFARSDIDLNLDSSFRAGRRGSVYDERESEYAIIDVPAGTRRVTVDMAREREQEAPSWRRDNGVRRSRGLGNELWTEITKDLVTREAIEDCGYQYEETEFFYYIFEYLHRDQIAELTDLTTDIRRRKLFTTGSKKPIFVFHRPKNDMADSTSARIERVRDIEYESIAGRERDRERERRTLDWDREDSRTEIIIESGRSNAGGSGRRRRYYY